MSNIRVGRQHTFSRAPVLLTFLRLHRAQRRRINYVPSHRCAFVAMRSGFQTMPGEHGAAEDDTAPAAVTGAPAGPGRRYGATAGPGRRFTPAAPPRDLQAALAPIDADKYVTKVFENLGVQDINPELVTCVCDLLLLCSYFVTHLGPRLVWLIKLSVTEWPTLSAQEKTLHTQMRQSF